MRDSAQSSPRISELSNILREKVEPLIRWLQEPVRPMHRR
jgi:hypothetical protein